MTSAANDYLTLLTNLNIEANRVDPDQTALKYISRREKQTTFVAIGALRANRVMAPFQINDVYVTRTHF